MDKVSYIVLLLMLSKGTANGDKPIVPAFLDFVRLFADCELLSHVQRVREPTISSRSSSSSLKSSISRARLRAAVKRAGCCPYRGKGVGWGCGGVGIKVGNAGLRGRSVGENTDIVVFLREAELRVCYM